MWYFSEKSFWRSTLLIVALYLKLCKPQTRLDTPKPIVYSGEAGGPNPKDIAPPWMKLGTPAGNAPNKGQGQEQGAAGAAAGAQQNRFTTPTTTVKIYIRTTPMRVSFAENCDYLAYYCLKAYDTGKLCGRTIYYGYYTFRNYCMLDYVNCMERFEVWQVLHMGECYEIKLLTEYLLYPYDDDYFLDHYYIMEDHK